MFGKKKSRIDGLFAQLEDVRDGRGKFLNTVLFSKRGDASVIIEMENPVQQYATDAALYMAYTDVLANIVDTLGEGYALQKQDIFCRQRYHHPITKDMEFLTRSYFKYFEGRPYTEIRTFLIITQEGQKSTFIKYDDKQWKEFHVKVGKVCDILKERGLWYHKLTKAEVNDYLHRYMSFHFQNGPFSMQNIKAGDDQLRMGQNAVKSFSVVDVDEIALPTWIKPYLDVPVNGYMIATDLMSFLAGIPDTDCVIYNQVIQIPAQRKLLRKLQAKAKRHGSMPDPSNKIAKADIEEVLNALAVNSRLLVNTNFNIMVSCPQDKLNGVTSYIETKLYECGIMPSKSAYNQLELWIDCFPGNAYSFNPDYDLFLTLEDAALCLFYKEHLKHSERTPLKTWYTDRQGLPVCIDITGKEGAVKLTDNSNFFCIGPSGSGKSFHMNSVVRQFLEQDTDVVMVDTGDSYEGICAYFEGTYITYSKEHPISMNPFRITEEEYRLNFGEKKNFLKSLLFLIYKGSEAPTKIEDKIINQTLVEYYEEYFHPFRSYTDGDRKRLREKLLLEDKKNGNYERYEEKIEEKYGDPYAIPELERGQGGGDPAQGDAEVYTPEEKEHHAKIVRQVDKLHNLVNDSAATQGEKDAANRQLMRLMPELIEGHYLMRIENMKRKSRKSTATRTPFLSLNEGRVGETRRKEMLRCILRKRKSIMRRLSVR